MAVEDDEDITVTNDDSSSTNEPQPQTDRPCSVVVMEQHSKWEMIQASLIRLAEGAAKTPDDVVREILELHPAYRNKWKFDHFQQFFKYYATAEESARFFDSTLPTIARLALSLPDVVDRPIPLLPTQLDGKVTLSQLQIASLLACAFLSLFPQRNSVSTAKTVSMSEYPSINFCPDFFNIAEPVASKFRFLFNYFDRWSVRLSDTSYRCGHVTFERRVATQQPRWAQSKAPLTSIAIEVGAIEEAGSSAFQLDFANKLLGGGVLRRGSAQEEIRFLICPELIVSRLLVQELSWNETVLVTGAERYSSYTGYSDALEYSGSFDDRTPRDEHGRMRVYVLAIDALDYSTRSGAEPSQQYQLAAVSRELLKCYCGFSFPHPEDDDGGPCPVATGNWGCGAFAGDIELKALIQWLAASVVHRPLRYFPFDQQQFSASLVDLSQLAIERKATVGQLFLLLRNLLESLSSSSNSSNSSRTSIFEQLTEAIIESFSSSSTSS